MCLGRYDAIRMSAAAQHPSPAPTLSGASKGAVGCEPARVAAIIARALAQLRGVLDEFRHGPRRLGASSLGLHFDQKN